MREIYSFESKIYASEVGKGGAYIIFPYDIRKEFGAGRVKVQATFDNVPYEGSIVNMGVKIQMVQSATSLDYEKIFVKTSEKKSVIL